MKASHIALAVGAIAVLAFLSSWGLSTGRDVKDAIYQLECLEEELAILRQGSGPARDVVQQEIGNVLSEINATRIAIEANIAKYPREKSEYTLPSGYRAAVARSHVFQASQLLIGMAKNPGGYEEARERFYRRLSLARSELNPLPVSAPVDVWFWSIVAFDGVAFAAGAFWLFSRRL